MAKGKNKKKLHFQGNTESSHRKKSTIPSHMREISLNAEQYVRRFYQRLNDNNVKGNQ